MISVNCLIYLMTCYQNISKPIRVQTTIALPHSFHTNVVPRKT